MTELEEELVYCHLGQDPTAGHPHVPETAQADDVM